MKGIILAAGKGTRLGPITCGIGSECLGVSKPLIPCYDKPTIYYPISDLIAAGVNDILIIAAPDNVDQFQSAIGDGSELGVSISYDVQPEPKGIAEAFIIAEDFIGNENVVLVFGDNIFSGEKFAETLRSSLEPEGATVFAYRVPNPEAFGVVEFDVNGRAVSLEEKPKKPKSHHAVVGIYVYSPEVVEIAKQLEPSDRGELEITDVNRVFLERGTLRVTKLDSDTNWFDTGTPESLLAAALFVQGFQGNFERLLGSPEASAYSAGFIDAIQLLELGEAHHKTPYGQRLIALAKEGWQ